MKWPYGRMQRTQTRRPHPAHTTASGPGTFRPQAGQRTSAGGGSGGRVGREWPGTRRVEQTRAPKSMSGPGTYAREPAGAARRGAARPPAGRAQYVASSSTSKTSAAFGGISGGAPAAP